MAFQYSLYDFYHITLCAADFNDLHKKSYMNTSFMMI